eukprot:CFRG3269T1
MLSLRTFRNTALLLLMKHVFFDYLVSSTFHHVAKLATTPSTNGRPQLIIPKSMVMVEAFKPFRQSLGMLI